jgi:hypothetical protein
VLDFTRDGSGDCVGFCCSRADSLVDIIVKEVGAKLKIQAERGDGRHREKQDNRYYGYQNVGNDQAASKPPEHLSAKPGQKAEEKIGDSDKAQERQKNRARNRGAERADDSGKNVEQNDP